MKSVILLYLLGLFCICYSCNNSGSIKPGLKATNTAKETATEEIQGAYIRLANNHFDFGQISRRKHPKVYINIEFTNTGKAPLVILKVDVSCGCISVEYPKEPILSGHSETLRVNVDIRSQKDSFNKAIFIKSNADNDVVLARIVGVVKK